MSTWPTCPRGLFTVRLPALALSISVPKPACLRALQREVELRRPGSWRNVFGDRFLGFPFLSTWASLGEERRICRPITDFFYCVYFAILPRGCLAQFAFYWRGCVFHIPRRISGLTVAFFLCNIAALRPTNLSLIIYFPCDAFLSTRFVVTWSWLWQ